MKRMLSLILAMLMLLSLGSVASADDVIELTLSHWGSTADAAVYQARVDLFNEQYKDRIHVTINYIPEDYATKLTTALASQTAADVLVIAEEANSFAYRRQLLALDDYLKNNGVDLEARVGAAAAGAYALNGKVYGIADRAGCSVLYYNKDLFDAAGVAYPTAAWTREDFLAAAKAITTEGEPAEKTWGYVQEDWFPYWMNWIYGGGGKVVDENGEVCINSAENVASLTFMRDLVGVHKVTPTRAQLAGIGAGTTASSMFASGKAAMYCTGAWGIASFKDVENLNWDMAVIWDNAAPAFGSAMCINAKTKYPDAAFEVVNFMTSAQAQALIAENCQDVPSNLEVLASPSFLEAAWSARPINMKVFVDAVPATFAPPTQPAWASWTGIWGELLDPIYDGQGDPAQILEEIQDAMIMAVEEL